MLALVVLEQMSVEMKTVDADYKVVDDDQVRSRPQAGLSEGERRWDKRIIMRF